MHRLLALEDTPQRIAFAFALGVCLAFSPFLGLHTFLGLTLAFFFHLNRVALLIGLFVNNPWTLVPIYGAGAYLGGLLVGRPSTIALPPFDWNAIWHSSFWVQLGGQWPIIKAILVGSSILAILSALISYPTALYLLQRERDNRSQLGCSQSN